MSILEERFESWWQKNYSHLNVGENDAVLTCTTKRLIKIVAKAAWMAALKEAA